MSHYRLLALDLDGTTLLDNKEISEATAFWVKKAVQEGITVSFATGRGLPNAERYRKELGLSSSMVLLNGAEIWKAPGILMERHFLDKTEIEQLHRVAAETNSWFWAYNVESFIKKPEWKKEMFQDNWMKFGIINDDPTIMSEIKTIISKCGNLEITQSDSNNLEMTLKGITKEYGVRKVCDLLDIELDQVMAIGDSYNDIQLIKSAGLGIAMGNANEDVLNTADFITATNEEDGVAKAIRKYLFENESVM